MELGEVHVYYRDWLHPDRVVVTDGVNEVEVPNVRQVTRVVKLGEMPVVELTVRGHLIEHRGAGDEAKPSSS